MTSGYAALRQNRLVRRLDLDCVYSVQGIKG